MSSRQNPGHLIWPTAWLLGHTVTFFWLWIWITDIGLVTFLPVGSNLIGPKNEGVSSPAIAVRTCLGLVEPAFSTPSASARQAAAASALWYSGVPPKRCWNAFA